MFCSTSSCLERGVEFLDETAEFGGFVVGKVFFLGEFAEAGDVGFLFFGPLGRGAGADVGAGNAEAGVAGFLGDPGAGDVVGELVEVGGERSATDGRRGAGNPFVEIVEVLVPQAVRGDAESAPGDAEALEDVVEVPDALLKGVVGVADVFVDGAYLALGEFEDFTLLWGFDQDDALATALGAVAYPDGDAEVCLEGAEHDGFLAPQAEGFHEAQLEAYPPVVLFDHADQGGYVDAGCTPGFVFGAGLGALDGGWVGYEIGGFLDHPGFSYPGGEGAQDGDAVGDGGCGEAAFFPGFCEGADVALLQVARAFEFEAKPPEFAHG